MKQYYYRVGSCKGHDANAKDCICWHDERTGPRAELTYAKNWCLNWRDKPINETEEAKVSKIPGVPDGWELVRIGAPQKGDWFVNWQGEPEESNRTFVYACFAIVRRIGPRLRKIGEVVGLCDEMHCCDGVWRKVPISLVGTEIIGGWYRNPLG
jgi:hypothetical protein